jgi:hypothetical protein
MSKRYNRMTIAVPQIMDNQKIVNPRKLWPVESNTYSGSEIIVYYCKYSITLYLVFIIRNLFYFILKLFSYSIININKRIGQI